MGKDNSFDQIVNSYGSGYWRMSLSILGSRLTTVLSCPLSIKNEMTSKRTVQIFDVWRYIKLSYQLPWRTRRFSFTRMTFKNVFSSSGVPCYKCCRGKWEPCTRAFDVSNDFFSVNQMVRYICLGFANIRYCFPWRHGGSFPPCSQIVEFFISRFWNIRKTDDWFWIQSLILVIGWHLYGKLLQ